MGGVNVQPKRRNQKFNMKIHHLHHLKGNFHSAAFSPDSLMAAFGDGNGIRVWNAVTGKTIAMLEGHKDKVSSLMFSPDGRRIVSASHDQILRIWNVASGLSMAILLGHSEEVLCAAWSPIGNTIVSGSKDATIRTWDGTSYEHIAVLTGHSDGVNSVAFSPDNTKIVSGSSDHSIRIWDALSGASLAVLEGHSDSIVSAIFVNKDRIFSGSRDNSIRRWDTKSDPPESQALTAHDGWVNSVAYSPERKSLITAGADCSFRIWDAISGGFLAEVEGQSPIHFAAISPNGRKVLSGSGGESIDVWDVTENVVTHDTPADVGDKSEAADIYVPQSVSIPSKPAPLFALIIGINEYKSNTISNLKGAVPDSEAVARWLEEDLNVPRSQMRILHNGEATRAAIIQAFHDLNTDMRTKSGDPILIFFAGNAGEIDLPPGLGGSEEKIMMLVPHDFGTNIDGRNVAGIPYSIINELLAQLAQTKGDNVTLMLDCVHAGSRSRPVAGFSGHGATSSMYRRPRSHVLLAACGPSEMAKEENGRGIFTKAVLDVTTTIGAHNLTYNDLIRRIILPQQNPQCVGFNTGRILFNSKAPSQQARFYSNAINPGYIEHLDESHPTVLDDYLRKYDVTFVVDDSGSVMDRDKRWPLLSSALAQIANKAKQHGADGFGICFLNSPIHETNITSESALMSIFGRVPLRNRTPMAARLKVLLDEAIKRLDEASSTPAYAKIKPLDIIVLTDTVPTDEPGAVIEAAAKKLDEGKHHPKLVRIRFLQISNDEHTKLALEVLGQGLTRNMVDTVLYEQPLTPERLTSILLGDPNPAAHIHI